MKPLVSRHLLAALTVLALVVAPAHVEARVVTSDDTFFSVDLGGVTVCFVEPPSLHVEEDCAGLDVKDHPVTSVADPVARVAYGILRGPGQGTSRPVLGTVTLLRAPSHATAPPDDVTAPQVGEDSATTISSGAPGTRLVPQSSKIAWSKDVPVVRTTLVAGAAIDADAGAGAGAGAAEKNAHRELITALGGRYVYITAWSGTREQGAELARLADAAAPTVDLKPEGRPIRKLNPWPGRLLFAFGILGLMLLRFRQKKKKKKQAAAKKPPR